jgi:uncharacterized protein YkwD
MRKHLNIAAIVLLLSLSFNVAEASTLSNVKSGLSDLFSFFNNSVIQKIEDDFCNQYILSISNGSWTAGQIRTKVGTKICSNYKGGNTVTPVTIANDIVPKNIETVLPKTNLPTNKVVSTGTSGSTSGGNQIIFWTNYNRKNNGGLSGLSENSVLSQIAKVRVEDMFAKQYFDHVSPTGDSASKEGNAFGYRYITIGENIALGNFNGAEGLVDAWMASPGHRANILNKNYTEIGVASEEGIYQGQHVSISAQIFGKPLSLCSEPETSIKTDISKYKTSAESLSSQMASIKTSLPTITDSAVYNEKVSEYNSLTKLYNNLIAEIKNLTTEYNNEVAVFNNCIKVVQ